MFKSGTTRLYKGSGKQNKLKNRFIQACLPVYDSSASISASIRTVKTGASLGREMGPPQKPSHGRIDQGRAERNRSLWREDVLAAAGMELQSGSLAEQTPEFVQDRAQ